MEQINNFCTGCVVGFERYMGYSKPHKKEIGRIKVNTDTYTTFEFQSDSGLDTTSIYNYSEPKKFILLPLKEELLSLEGFEEFSTNVWESPNKLIFISRNEKGSKKEWNLKIFDENQKLDLFVNFNYLHELQFFCLANQTELNFKFGTIRLVYEKEIQS